MKTYLTEDQLQGVTDEQYYWDSLEYLKPITKVFND